MNVFIQWFSEDLVYALGWTFFHSIWQASFIALILAFTLQMTPVKRANLRYQFSILALFSVFIAGLCTFIFYYGTYSNGEVSVTGTSPIAGSEMSVETTSFLSTFGYWQQSLEAYLPFVVAIWITGMIIFAIRMAGGVFYIKRIRATSQSIGAPYTNVLASFQKKLKFKKVIRMASSAWVKVPMVVGHLKPFILFPVGAMNQLTPQELEAILAHELAHIQRFDYLQNMIQSVIEIVFYYHPAIWWISAVIRSERENTCDDIAIQLCGSSMTYAKALVQLETIHHRSPVLAVPLFKSKAQLLMRIKRILNQPYNKSNTMEKLIATSVCLVCFVFLTMSATKPNSEENTWTAELTDPNEVAFVDEVSPPAIMMDIAELPSDTIPKKSTTKTKISKYTDDEHIEVLIENGTVKELKIDGKVIPQNQLDEYQLLVDELISDSETVPPPPPPPPAPPFPKHIEEPHSVPQPPHPPHEPVPAAPPAPDFPTEIAPPPPPPPPHAPFQFFHKNGNAIIHEIEDDGKRIIKIERKGLMGDDDVEIIVDGDVIVIDGIEIEADTLLYNGDYSFKFFGDSMHFPKMERFHWKFDKDDLIDGANNWFGIIKEGQNDSLLQWYSKENVWPERFEFDNEKMKEYLFDNENEIKNRFFKNQEDIEKNLFERQKGLEKDLFEKQEYYELLKEKNKEAHNEQKAQIEKLHKQMERERGLGSERLKRDQNRLQEESVRRYYDHAYKKIDDKYHQNALLKALINDGLIDPDGSYHVKLTDKKLRINGEKMPKVLHQKYRKIYEQQKGEDFGTDLNVEYRNEIKKKRTL